jgi:nucleotide-binding universal stress UspA family protein
MFKHILVPLDGSTLAEAPLPVAAYLARTLHARVTLIHVVEKDAPEEVHGEPHLREATEAQHYLEGLRASYAETGQAWDCHVHAPGADDVAGGIVAHEKELRPDLILMSTHGPGRLERLLRGSLAQRVVALGRTPLLLARPEAHLDRDFSLSRLLIPLDGTSRHEGGLAPALALAGATNSRLQLLSVIPSPSVLAGSDATLARFLPGTTRTMQDLAAANLRNYLAGIRERAAAQGVEAGIELRHGDVADGIIEAAADAETEMIILATHGKAGASAFWANSVAARVQARTTRLLLLVPI